MLSDFDPTVQITTVLVLLLKVAAVLGAAWLLARTSRRASAAIRHGIWFLGLLSALVLPLANAWLPPLHLDLPVPLVLNPVDEGKGVPAGAAGAVAAPGTFGVADGVGRMIGPNSDFGQPSVAPAGETATRFPWSSIILFVWILGVALRLVWLALLSSRTHLLTRQARSAGDERQLGLARALATELGIRRTVRVLYSPIASMPVAWGIFRPVVILPAGAVEWPEDRLRVVLLHELAHIRRWDYLTSLVAELACALYWPVPLAWLARQRLKFEQEQACDDRVLATGTGSLEYAEHLLAIARAFYGERADLGLAVAMAREVSLKYRIRAILDAEVDRRPLRSGRGMGLAILLVSLFLTVAAARGSQPDQGLDLEARLSTDPLTPQPVLDVRSTALVEAAPAFVWLEAEDGTLTESVRTDGSLEASGAAYLVLSPRGRDESSTAPEVRADFDFQVETAGDYRIWARLRHSERNDAALFASLDGEPAVRWALDDDRGWGWREVTLVAAASMEGDGGVPLVPGTHSLSIGAASGEVRIDRLLVTNDPAFAPSDRGPTEPGFQTTYHLLEAERGDLAGRLRSPENDRASAGEYLVFSSSRRDDPAGSASFVFNVSVTGRYLVWGRVSAPDDDSNSLFVSVNGGPELIWDVRERDRGDADWSWDPVSARSGEDGVIDPMVFDLRAGPNILDLRTREDGVRLDALLVTNDLTRRPRGIWPDALPATPANMLLEIESAALEAPFTVREDSEAGGGRFVLVDAATRRPADPGEAGMARIAFVVDDPGIYSLWARTISRGGDEDSFWVRLDDSEWFRWTDVPRTDNWVWSAVEDSGNADQILQFLLDPGAHVLEIAGREGGIMLDRLLLTNDPLVDPDSAF